MLATSSARRARRCALSTLALAALVAIAGCTREARDVEKTLVTILPTDYAPNTLLVSKDGTVWAYVVSTPEGERVVESRGVGPIHKKCLRLAFSPKTNRLFYWTLDGPDDALNVTLFADGTTMPTQYQAPGEVGFSADGTRWTAIGAAAGATKGEYGEISLVVDGAVAARHDDMSLPALSADGKHLAYLARGADGLRILVDGTPGRAFPPPTTPCGTAAQQAATPPDLALRHSVRFLPDGGILVVTRDPEGWGVYRDGLRIASYAVSAVDREDDDCLHLSRIAPGTIKVAEAAPAVFWWERVAGDAEIWRVVRNGHPIDDVTCVEPWRRHPPEPSADGTTVVYPCVVQKPDSTREVWLIHGKDKYGPYGDVWGIAPTLNGTHVAYGAAIGPGERDWAILVNGKERLSGFSAVWRPRLSEDGATLVWQGVRDPLDRSVFGINERQIGSFDGVLWGPEFEPENRVAWVIRRGRKLTRVVVPIELAAEQRRGSASR